MKRRTYACILMIAVLAGAFGAGADPVTYHLSFEDFDFLADCFVARSGMTSIEERGLTLETGRFGRGLMMNIPPGWKDIDNLTALELDLIVGAIYKHRNMKDAVQLYNEPIIWGAGRLNTASGAVAFWVKGALREGLLFNQSGCVWGRKERFLLAIESDGDGRLSAWLEDARYVRHAISSDRPLNDGDWNHVALNWDRAQGLELFVNGESVASSWGEDAWWETKLPGLMQFPMPKVVYDELYILSRPLERAEIRSLMESNAPPRTDAPPSKRDAPERERIARALGLSHAMNLPKIRPSEGGHVLSFREITPDFMGDGHVPARFCMDGRYELAWPHPIALYTIIPGDVDFLAEKLDIDPPQGIPFNYISIEGNLTDLPVFTEAKRRGDGFTGIPLVNIPNDRRFFHGEMIDRRPLGRITLPFIKGYGTPGEFEGDVHLPLTGDTRVHEIGLFDVTETIETHVPGETSYWFRREGSLDGRYAFAMSVMHPPAERTAVHGYRTPAGDDEGTLNTGYLRRNALVTAPMTGEHTIGSILLDLPVKTAVPEDIFLVRLRDPGVPNRIWTHAEVKLGGFDDGGRMKLLLDFPPMMLAEGDRVWIELVSLNDAAIGLGGSDGARIVLKPAPVMESKSLYETKALMPAMAEFMRAYHFPPWVFEKIPPDFERPHALGGPYDTIFPAQAVKRVLPHSRLAEFYVEYAKDKYYWGNITKPAENIAMKEFDKPPTVPAWAFYQHLIQNFRYRILDWMAANQNDDGQFGGGWNDDTLIMRGRLDMPLDGSDDALRIFDRVFRGLDTTRLFAGGYCRISPIDRLHNGDFVRERYRLNIYKLGDPYVYRRSLETAWRWDKPDQTPVNWGLGKAFLFDKKILEWYWGKNIPHTAFKGMDENALNERLRRFASFLDDIAFHRYTEARVHTDNQGMYDERLITRMILGGNADQTVSVSWPEGGGEDLARWVTYADSTGLTCRMFSFDPLERSVTARLFRIEPGEYEIALARDRNGNPGAVLTAETLTLRRFDTISFTVPSKRPVILTVTQKKRGRPVTALPDLAIADYECDRSENTLTVHVSNFGDAPSKRTTVVVTDSAGKKLGEAKVPLIESVADFVEKSRWVTFKDIPRAKTLIVTVDPKNKIREIFEGNNTAVIP